MVTLIVEPENPIELTPEAINALDQQLVKDWEKRVKALNLNPKHKRTIEMQAEFMIGAWTAIQILSKSDKLVMPPSVCFSIMRGDYLTSDEL